MDVEVGDRVRIDIPDETDEDHRYHGEHGVVKEVFSDDAGVVSGKSVDSMLFRVELESGIELDFRGRDVRPPLE
jgi:ribosomal protein L21E